MMRLQDRQLEALQTVREDPRGEAGLEGLSAALRSKHAIVLTEAANIAGGTAVAKIDEALVRAFERLLDDLKRPTILGAPANGSPTALIEVHGHATLQPWQTSATAVDAKERKSGGATQPKYRKPGISIQEANRQHTGAHVPHLAWSSPATDVVGRALPQALVRSVPVMPSSPPL